MAKGNESKTNISSLQPGGSNPLTTDEAVDMIFNARIELFNDFADINRSAGKGNFIRSADFSKAEENYNAKIGELSSRINQSDYGLIMDKAKEKFAKWKEEHNDYHKEVYDTEQINKIFSRDYITAKAGKKTDIDPDTKTQEELFNQLLGKNNGLAFAGVGDNSAEIALVTKNMKHFHDKGVGVVYVVGNPDDIETLNKLSKDQVKNIIADISINMEKTPSSSKEYAAYKESMNIASLVLSAKENNVSLEAINSILQDNGSRSLPAQQHAIARNNFILTDDIRDSQLLRPIFNKDEHHNKYIIIGDIKNFISTLDKSNGNVDEALGIPVITLRTGDSRDPLIEKGKSSNGADFHLRTHDCRPDTKGLAIAGDSNDMAGSILKNMDRIKSPDEKKFAASIAAYLAETAESMRKDYKQSFEVCEVTQQEAKVPLKTPEPHASMVRIASR